MRAILQRLRNPIPHRAFLLVLLAASARAAGVESPALTLALNIAQRTPAFRASLLSQISLVSEESGRSAPSLERFLSASPAIEDPWRGESARLTGALAAQPKVVFFRQRELRAALGARAVDRLHAAAEDLERKAAADPRLEGQLRSLRSALNFSDAGSSAEFAARLTRLFDGSGQAAPDSDKGVSATDDGREKMKIRAPLKNPRRKAAAIVVHEDSQTALLPLDGAASLPDFLDFRGEKFVRKSALHVTLIGFHEDLVSQAIAARKDVGASREAIAQEVNAALRAAAQGLQFEISPIGRYRLVREKSKKSIIELLSVSDREKFYARVENLLGLPRNSVHRPPAHVTLFTEVSGDPAGRGIGLYTPEEMTELSTPVTDASELERLSVARSIWR